jgi:ABC-type multidrug transport system fused ATPase/permease subunit
MAQLRLGVPKFPFPFSFRLKGKKNQTQNPLAGLVAEDDDDDLPVKSSHRHELKILFGFMRPQKLLLLGAGLCGVFRVILQLLPSLLSLLIFDYAVNRKNLVIGEWQIEPDWLIGLAAGLVGLILGLKSLLVYFQRLLAEKAGQTTVYQMRKASYQKLQRLPVSFFQVRNGGKIILRFIGDMNSLLWLAGRGIVDLLVDFVTLLVVLGLMFWLNPLLTFASLFSFPFFLVALWKEGRFILEEGRLVRRMRAELAGNLQEQFNNISTAHSLGDKTKLLKDFEKINVGLRDGLVGLTRRGGKLDALAVVASSLMSGIILLLGAVLVLHGQLTVGELVAFYFLSGIIIPLFRQLARFNQRYNRALAGLERVVALLETEEPAPAKESTPIAVPNGLIEVRDVSFAHTKKRGQIFEELSLRLEPCKLTAIIGDSGSGKSTLANLLAGRYQPDKGSICLDGQNLTEYSQNSLSKAVAVVEQASELFATSLLSNICYGWDWKKEGLTQQERDERIQNAISLVGFDGFVSGLHKGRKTKAGQRGLRFSNQQRARIALLRAIVRQPPVLIIDGAEGFCNPALLKHLRTLVEMAKYDKNHWLKNVIVLTTDPLQAACAHQIAVLKYGRVFEYGTVPTLVTQESGVFHRLVQTQLNALNIQL